MCQGFAPEEVSPGIRMAKKKEKVTAASLITFIVAKLSMLRQWISNDILYTNNLSLVSQTRVSLIKW